MNEAIRGDVLTKEEMKRRGIVMVEGTRGGMEFRSVHSHMLTIADQLLEKGFIERYHFHDAMLFMDLRRAFYAAMGIKWVRVDASDAQESGLSSGDASRLYDAIRHHIGVKRAASVTSIVADSFESTNVLPAFVSDVYRHAFEELTKAMEEVDKKREEVLAYV